MIIIKKLQKLLKGLEKIKKQSMRNATIPEHFFIQKMTRFIAGLKSYPVHKQSAIISSVVNFGFALIITQS